MKNPRANKPSGSKPKPATPKAPAKNQGPQRYAVKPWQSGKPHLTAAQLKGKSRKVH